MKQGFYLIQLRSHKAIPLRNGFVIGRDQDCEIIIKSDLVSSRHLSVFIDSSDCKISDLQTKNGTRLNGKFIDPHKKVLLKNGDRLQLGKHLFAFFHCERDGQEPDSSYFDDSAFIQHKERLDSREVQGKANHSFEHDLEISGAVSNLRLEGDTASGINISRQEYDKLFTVLPRTIEECDYEIDKIKQVIDHLMPVLTEKRIKLAEREKEEENFLKKVEKGESIKQRLQNLKIQKSESLESLESGQERLISALDEVASKLQDVDSKLTQLREELVKTEAVKNALQEQYDKLKKEGIPAVDVGEIDKEIEELERQWIEIRRFNPFSYEKEVEKSSELREALNLQETMLRDLETLLAKQSKRKEAKQRLSKLDEKKDISLQLKNLQDQIKKLT